MDQQGNLQAYQERFLQGGLQQGAQALLWQGNQGIRHRHRQIGAGHHGAVR